MHSSVKLSPWAQTRRAAAEAQSAADDAHDTFVRTTDALAHDDS